jgi:hypothetical protein
MIDGFQVTVGVKHCEIEESTGPKAETNAQEIRKNMAESA